MGLRAQLGWMRNGADRTSAALADYATELRDLQLKVEALTTVVARLDSSIGSVAAESTASIEAMKQQLRTVTDDLGDRIGAMSDRLDSAAADR
jgi:uncharacterized protein YlxW (UPF0749 family)